MTIFSTFSANFPPHSNTILVISCVHASNWFTHLQQTRQIDGQNDNSVLTVYVHYFSWHVMMINTVHKLIHSCHATQISTNKKKTVVYIQAFCANS